MIFVSLSVGTGLHAQNPSNPQCEEVLHWIYKELSLNNLDLAYQRTNQKFQYALLQVYKNTNPNEQSSDKLVKIYNTLKKIDPKFKRALKSHGKQWKKLFINNKGVLEKQSLMQALASWKKLQEEQPQLFAGISKDLLIDDWDIQTFTLVDQVGKINFSDSNLKNEIMKLQNELNSSRTIIFNTKKIDLQKIQKNLSSTQKELMISLRNNYNRIASDYADVCSAEELNQFILEENYVCPIPKKEADFLSLTKQIRDLSGIFDLEKPSLSPIIAAETQPDAAENLPEEVDVPVEILNYKQSHDKRSTHCKRDPAMISTIVIHHTATPENVTPHGINQLHLERTTPSGEPWYMIGYNYIVSETYSGATAENLKVFQGRSPETKGAHAGGYTPALSPEERAFYGQFKIQCGNDDIGYTEKSALDDTDSNGGISGNLISYGIAVIGNYADVEYKNIGGYMMPININQSLSNLMSSKQPSEHTIDLLAKFSCSLQKQNSRITQIVPHQYFKATTCPGSLILYLNKVAEKAKEYGCDFNVSTSKGKK